jgi:hypothetical protein
MDEFEGNAHNTDKSPPTRQGSHLKQPTALTAHERAQLTHDIAEALQEMSEYPERTAHVLRVLNNRIRPLGFRLDYAGSQKP